MKLGSRRLNVANTAYAPTSNDCQQSASRSLGLRKDDVAVTSALLGLGRASLAASLEHLEHPVGYEKTADDVDRPERDRDRARHLHERVGAGVADHQKAA